MLRRVEPPAPSRSHRFCITLLARTHTFTRMRSPCSSSLPKLIEPSAHHGLSEAVTPILTISCLSWSSSFKLKVLQTPCEILGSLLDLYTSVCLYASKACHDRTACRAVVFIVSRSLLLRTGSLIFDCCSCCCCSNYQNCWSLNLCRQCCGCIHIRHRYIAHSISRLCACLASCNVVPGGRSRTSLGVYRLSPWRR